jgi:hypothetical protein
MACREFDNEDKKQTTTVATIVGLGGPNDGDI